ncbi:MAG: DNA-binding protein [Pseudomonadota bacterium]
MIEPRQIWWTTSDLAAAALPGLPTTRQGIDRLARTDWRPQADFARRREGKGGGWEYNWQILPLLARRRLLAEVEQPKATGKPTRDEVWAWFEGQKDRVKAKAETRLRILQAVEAIAGHRRHPASRRELSCERQWRLHSVHLWMVSDG